MHCMTFNDTNAGTNLAFDLSKHNIRYCFTLESMCYIPELSDKRSRHYFMIHFFAIRFAPFATDLLDLLSHENPYQSYMYCMTGVCGKTKEKHTILTNRKLLMNITGRDSTCERSRTIISYCKEIMTIFLKSK